MISIESAQKNMKQRDKLVEILVRSKKPELLDLLFTYQNEAIAARNFLHRNLLELDPGSEILEIGGGILALTVQLASEGYKVTSVEPAGKGFTEITYFMELYLELAEQEGLEYKLICSPIEDCNFENDFHFIFSFNVMEHLKDPFGVISNILVNLKTHGKYRFFCPNYDFPYEPHFGKWLISRRNNAFYLKASSIGKGSIKIKDLEGLYQTLNFLTLRKILDYLRRNRIEYEINSFGLYELIQRSLTDIGLQNRHLPLFRCVAMAKKIRILELTKYFPVNFQPTMDVTLHKL